MKFQKLLIAMGLIALWAVVACAIDYYRGFQCYINYDPYGLGSCDEFHEGLIAS